MGQLLLGTGIFLISLNIQARSFATSHCDSLRAELLENCNHFSLNEMTYFDRTSLELDPESNRIHTMDEYYFNGDVCPRSDDYFRVSIVYKSEGRNDRPQCAVRINHRGGDGSNQVLEYVYSDNTRVYLNRLSQDQAYNSDLRPEFILDRREKGILIGIGRTVTNVIDRVTGNGRNDATTRP